MPERDWNAITTTVSKNINQYDAGYIPPANIAENIYNQEVNQYNIDTRQSVGALSKPNKGEDRWISGSKTSADYALNRFKTWSGSDKEYTDKVTELEGRINNAKTDDERQKFLNQLQALNQGYRWKNNPELSKTIAKGMAQTQTSLQYLINNASADDKPKIIGVLKSYGLADDKGKVLAGMYKAGNADKISEINEKLSPFVQNYGYEKDGSIKEGFAQAIDYDKVYEKRVPYRQELVYPSEKERDATFNNDKYDKVVENGRVFYVDKKNTENVYEPLVLRTKKVGKDQIGAYNESTDAYGNTPFKKLAGLPEGVREQWITEEPAVVEPAPQKTAEPAPLEEKPKTLQDVNIAKALKRSNLYFPPFEQRPPSALTIFPEYLPRVDRLTPMKVTPEEALRNNYRSLGTMEGILGQDTSYINGANLAQIQERTTNANNEAVSRANEMNAQFLNNIENQNANSRNQEEVMKSNYIKGYNAQVAQAMRNTENELASYEDKQYKALMDQIATMEELRLYESMAPNVRWTQGQGVDAQTTGNEFFFDGYGNTLTADQIIQANRFKNNQKNNTKK